MLFRYKFTKIFLFINKKEHKNEKKNIYAD